MRANLLYRGLRNPLTGRLRVNLVPSVLDMSIGRHPLPWAMPCPPQIYQPNGVLARVSMSGDSPKTVAPQLPAAPPPVPPFFFFAFTFFLLLSLGFNLPMPALHTSWYLAKKPSRSSGCTTVESFSFSDLSFFPLPLVARMMRGRGLPGLRSGVGFSGDGWGRSWLYVTT